MKRVGEWFGRAPARRVARPPGSRHRRDPRDVARTPAGAVRCSEAGVTVPVSLEAPGRDGDTWACPMGPTAVLGRPREGSADSVRALLSGSDIDIKGEVDGLMPISNVEGTSVGGGRASQPRRARWRLPGPASRRLDAWSAQVVAGLAHLQHVEDHNDHHKQCDGSEDPDPVSEQLHGEGRRRRDWSLAASAIGRHGPQLCSSPPRRRGS